MLLLSARRYLATAIYLADTAMQFTDSAFRTNCTNYPNDAVTVFSPMSDMLTLPAGGLIEGYPNMDPTKKTGGILFKSHAATGFEPETGLQL